MKYRAIEKDMMEAFQEGDLKPLLKAVKMDDTLDLELRGDWVNIYYRGGSLFKVSSKNGKAPYKIYFNTKYCINDQYQLEEYPEVAKAVHDIPLYKQAMDWWIKKHPKYEREFQQVIVRENNNSGNISRGTDYYIIDIEYANQITYKDGVAELDEIEKAYAEDSVKLGSNKSKGARFDMVAVKWLSNGAVRKDLSKATLSLIEVKYGSGAMKGKSGVVDHLMDFREFLSDEKNWQKFCDDMTAVFKQKWRLGLMDGLKGTIDSDDVKISYDKPEVIFVFANHDPESTILENLWDSDEIRDELDKSNFDVKIANASSMGYCLYADKMEKKN